LAKPNYSFQKRQRDLAKKQKKEEKRKKKLESGEPAPADAEAGVTTDLPAPDAEQAAP
jgi:hypothetical protein